MTRLEAIDWVGAALSRAYEQGEKSCDRLRRPSEVSVPEDIDRQAFYFDSYKTLLQGLPPKATKKLIYGVVTDGNKRFDGNASLTKADAAVIINRYFLRAVDRFAGAATSSATPSVAPANSVVQLTDVPESAWFFGDVKEMTERWGVLDTQEGKFQPDLVISREEFIFILTASLDKASQIVAASSKNCAPVAQKPTPQPSSPPEPSPTPQPSPAPQPTPQPVPTPRPPVQASELPRKLILAPINFTFNTSAGYIRCLEDVLQLYQNKQRFKQQSRQSDCLPEVFQAYTEKGFSKEEAFELVRAADIYATTTFTSRLFPPKGQRQRVGQLLGFSYEIDVPK